MRIGSSRSSAGLSRRTDSGGDGATADRAELTRRGHDLRLIDDWSPGVGGGQGFMSDPESGALLGGADPRRDGYAIAF